MSKLSEATNLIIDVDQVIKKRNDDNPELRPLTRKDLAKELGVGVQLFSDWKSGKTPKLIYRLLKLMEIGDCQMEYFLKK